MTRWFLDVEYVNANTWVSAALVSECGTQVLYAENQEEMVVNDFVRHNVLPGLWAGRWRCLQSVWVDALTAAVKPDDEVLSDHPGDLPHWQRWQHLAPDRLPAWGLLDLWDGPATYWRGRDAWWQAHPEAPKHHALADAWSLQQGWRSRDGQPIVLMGCMPFTPSSPWAQGFPAPACC